VALLSKKDRADDGDSAASAKGVSSRLRTLEERGFTGAVEISVKGSNAEAQIYFYEGGIYATHLDGYAPVMMDRLLTEGVLDGPRWDDLAAIVGAHGSNPRVGPIAVEQEWMTVDELVNLHQELLIASLGAVLAVAKARVERETAATTGDYCSLPQDVPRLLRLVQGRQQRLSAAWEAIDARCEPEELVLRRDSAAVPANLDRAEFRALFALIDGERSTDEIASLLGLTRADAIRAASLLVLAGAVAVDHDRRASAPSDRLLVPEAWGGSLDSPRAATPIPVPVARPVLPAPAHQESVPSWTVPGLEPWQPERPEPEQEYVPEPEPQYVPEPEPQYVPEPEPQYVPVPEPEPEYVPEPEPEYVPEPEPEYVPEPETQYVAEPPVSRRRQLQEATAQALALEQLLSDSVAAEQEALARSAVIRQRLREALAEVAALSAAETGWSDTGDEPRGEGRHE
jgi:outer membrane biosynthesis protein TonB